MNDRKSKTKRRFNIPDGFISLVVRYGFWILALALLWSTFKRILKPIFESLGFAKPQVEKDVERRSRIENTIDSQGLGAAVSYDQLVADVTILVEALGVNYPWWHPAGWTEDEAQAIDIVSRYSRVTFPLLAEEYSGQTSGRLLANDLVRYLRPSQLDMIRAIVF
ncbi:MAG: hypothetical protein AAFN81_27970 [Bacteroidota bacterium]